VILFQKVGSRNLALADRFFELQMQEVIIRLEERVAFESIQTQRPQQSTTFLPTTTLSPLH